MGIEKSDYEKLNAFNLMKEQLAVHIKERLTDEILAEQLAEFENKIRPIIVEKVKNITFECVESFQDYMNMRNEMRMLISIDGVEHEKGFRPKYFK